MADLIVYDENLIQLVKDIMVVQGDECRENCFSKVSSGSWEKMLMKKENKVKKKLEWK